MLTTINEIVFDDSHGTIVVPIKEDDTGRIIAFRLNNELLECNRAYILWEDEETGETGADECEISIDPPMVSFNSYDAGMAKTKGKKLCEIQFLDSENKSISNWKFVALVSKTLTDPTISTLDKMVLTMSEIKTLIYTKLGTEPTSFDEYITLLNQLFYVGDTTATPDQVFDGYLFHKNDGSLASGVITTATDSEIDNIWGIITSV